LLPIVNGLVAPIGLALALMTSLAPAGEGVERREGRTEMAAMKVTAQYLRSLTALFAQGAPDQANTTTVIIGIRG
jgi:hypothetical protein